MKRLVRCDVHIIDLIVSFLNTFFQFTKK